MIINSISTIKNIGYRTLKSVRNFILKNNMFSVNFAPPLEKDVFELSTKKRLPEVLSYSPNIIEGIFDAGIKEPRIKYFNTNFRAYNFEGYDCEFPAEYVCIDSRGDRRIKPHIFIDFVEVKPEYARQGAYSNLIKQLAVIAKEEKDCEGRIILNARKIERPGTAQIPSPSIAHWKCGFRFANKEDNKIMHRVLNGELPPEQAPEGYMYYALI